MVLPPVAAEDFDERFVGANVSGSAVLNGQSAFGLEDFTDHRQVMRDHLDLEVDTTLPLEMAASPCRAEGVPGGRAILIRAGRLMTPILDLRYAARANFPPTPLPRGYSGLLLRAPVGGADLSSLVRSVPTGLMVLSVLGVHSQDFSSGNYSLVASQARVIRDGELGGKVKAVLAGNFFDNLASGETRFARVRREHHPALLLHCFARVERAE